MKWRTHLLLAAAGILGALSFSSSSAWAGHECHPSRAHRGHGGYQRYEYVPRYIARESYHDYAPYRAKRVYHGAHRHYHQTYVFPVVVGHQVAHRPYTYCGDRLIFSGSLRLPRLAIDFDYRGRDHGGYDDYADRRGHRHGHDDWSD
jgi:hypothetical protein